MVTVVRSSKLDARLVSAKNPLGSYLPAGCFCQCTIRQLSTKQNVQLGELETHVVW